MQPTEDLQKRILVVEDEGLIAADLKMRIKRLGYPSPSIARSGEEALERAMSTPFDLVLMDIRLKGEMDGIATAAALRSRLRMPVVYLTAHADQQTIERAKITEPLGYILKPISDGDLRTVIPMALYKATMERRLRSGAAWLATMLRSVGEGIVASNSDGDVAFMNPCAERLTGWPDGQARGRQLMDVLCLHDEVTGVAAKNPVFDLAEGENRSYTLVSQSGARTLVEVECFENRSGDEVLGSVVTVRDIGHRREMEVRLLQSQRMDAIANMAGGLAHDFNNQLTVILGYAEELNARLTGEDRKHIDEIRQAASLAASTTTQLLAIGRHGGERFEVLSVHELILDVRPLIVQALAAQTVGAQTPGEAATLTTQLDLPLGYIRADRGQFLQLLLHLALFARGAMPAGGEMRIESSTIEIGADDPLARQYRPGAYVKLRVSDNGESIEPANLARIFEPRFDAQRFVQRFDPQNFSAQPSGIQPVSVPPVSVPPVGAQPVGAQPVGAQNEQFGNGLGLSLVHSIVLESGGYIGAESTAGKGTTFEILFPCVGTFYGAAEASASTILLVEDEDGVRRLMYRFLEREGYQLLTARNAEEAEEIADVYPNQIHLMVTDVVMPGMTGPQLAERLKPRRPGMKVLFVSGYRHDALDQKGLLGRGVQILTKPFPPAQLLHQVQLLLRQGEAQA